jgi:serine/threonine protein kinase
MRPREASSRAGLRPEDHAAAATAEALDGRFRIERAIGRGGMADVYAATELASGRRVALKRLAMLADVAKQVRNAELFEREFHVLSSLQHPRIVEVEHYAIAPDGPYYTMELLDGGDLQELAPLPWRTVCAIGRDVCSALSLLHSRRLIHRDLSPRNVRLTRAGTAKLIDFGALAGFGTSKVLVGTPPCCAPESVRTQPLDGRTDLFALGATLYFALVGQHAYAARSFDQLGEIWLAGVARPSSQIEGVPPELDALLLDLLRLEPDARPAPRTHGPATTACCARWSASSCARCPCRSCARRSLTSVCSRRWCPSCSRSASHRPPRPIRSLDRSCKRRTSPGSPS